MLFWLLIVSLLIYDTSCLRVKLTCEQVRAFVDGHNWKRFNVAQGYIPGQPAAANMKHMIWDEELAEKAARWAENGVFIHNPDRKVWSERWDMVGENIHTNTWCSTSDEQVMPNITEALESWFNEYNSYNFQPFNFESIKLFGHYTQMVWATTNRVGCGISQKKENHCTTTLIVCDYGPTGNYFGQLPYSTSPDKGYLQCHRDECYQIYGNC